MDNQEIGRYQNMLPSRAVLARLSLFGTSAEARESANAILRALPPMSADERRRYYDELWCWSLPEDLEQSPIGQQTLAMLRANQPTAEKPEGNVAPVPVASATAQTLLDAQAPQEPTPETSAETPNEYMARLDWPPRPTPQPPKPTKDDEPPHRWVAGTPSKPDKSLRPLPPDENFSNNDPIY